MSVSTTFPTPRCNLYIYIYISLSKNNLRIRNSGEIHSIERVCKIKMRANDRKSPVARSGIYLRQNSFCLFVFLCAAAQRLHFRNCTRNLSLSRHEKFSGISRRRPPNYGRLSAIITVVRQQRCIRRSTFLLGKRAAIFYTGKTADTGNFPNRAR